MNKYYLSLFTTFFLYLNISAQTEDSWIEERTPYQLSSEELEHPTYILKHETGIEFYQGPNGIVADHFLHRIIRVNNDDAINENNRIFVPLGSDGILKSIKARTISAEGKITNLDQSEIKEVKDENADQGYKIFAIEGATKGSEIEFQYVVTKSPGVFFRNFFQFKEPVKSASYTMTLPDYLEFEFKSYNGLNEVVHQHLDDEKLNVYSLNMENIEGLEEEEFSAHDNSRLRLETKLAYNLSNGKKSKLYTWTDASTKIFDRLYELESKEVKTVEKLIKSSKVGKGNTLQEKVDILEEYLKDNFIPEERAMNEDLTIINKYKYADEIGMTKLFLNCLKQLNIDAEIYLTSESSDVHFDKDFESWNYLEKYLIHIPELNRFIAPFNLELKNGVIPSSLQATEALVIKPVYIGEQAFATYSFALIPEAPAIENVHNMYLKIRLNETLDAIEADFKNVISGFQGYYLKWAFENLEEKDREEVLKDLVKFITEDLEIKENKISLLNNEFKNWNKPIITESKFTSRYFIEKAGDLIIVKVGELIGPQTEMYQEKERKTDIVNEFNRLYEREIIIDIPAGYSVQNPEDLIFDYEVKEKDKPVYYFKSSYEIKGQQLIISIDEAYEMIKFPKARFQEFRKVVNAAADWNKVKLLFEKK